jgi:small subunit ribosomal protein S27Ae
MAAPKPAAKKAAPAAKPKAKGKMISSIYEVSGNSIKRKNKSCPKCGNGFTLANHKDRVTCGKCAYTERK